MATRNGESSRLLRDRKILLRSERSLFRLELPERHVAARREDEQVAATPDVVPQEAWSAGRRLKGGNTGLPIERSSYHRWGEDRVLEEEPAWKTERTWKRFDYDSE